MNECEILVKFYKPPDMGKLLLLQLCSLGELFDEPMPKKKKSIKEVMDKVPIPAGSFADRLQEAVNEGYRESEKRNPPRLWRR